MGTLRPQLKQMVSDVTGLKTTAKASLGKLSSEALNWSPSPDRWSIAQILHHLNMIGDAFMIPFNEALKQAAPLSDGNQEIKYGFIEQKVIQSMGVGAKIKLPVPPMWEPAQPADPTATLRNFEELQEKFAAVFSKANIVDLSSVKVTSPANKLFKFRLVVFMECMVQHQRYHWAQVEALLQDPGLPR